ncbi:MAG: hypothetical protein JO121_10230 [Deltaproteobacteria bacterium]|nr:hypothetical protein [Deltaproteobacteria bacterium]
MSKPTKSYQFVTDAGLYRAIANERSSLRYTSHRLAKRLGAFCGLADADLKPAHTLSLSFTMRAVFQRKSSNPPLVVCRVGGFRLFELFSVIEISCEALVHFLSREVRRIKSPPHPAFHVLEDGPAKAKARNALLSQTG